VLVFIEEFWWAMQVSNLRPLQCEDSFRPLLSLMNSLT